MSRVEAWTAWQRAQVAYRELYIAGSPRAAAAARLCRIRLRQFEKERHASA